MTIEDVKNSIQEAIRKRDFLCEYSPENYKLLEKYLGTFQAVLSGRGQEKYLIPETGTAHFLYRGQNVEKAPCIPTIYRGDPDDVTIMIDRMRQIVFKRLLASHPVVDGFFRRHHFVVNEEGLAQHYGLKTSVLDLTSSLDVALFFAVCKFVDDHYEYYPEGEHTGVLYVFDPVLDNEPSPSGRFDKYMVGNIQPIGLQAFPRPGAQCGYGLKIPKGQSTKSWMFEFSFTAEESKAYYEKYNNGDALWVKDRLVAKADEVAQMTEFSFSVFNEAFDSFRPSGWSKSRMKNALRDIRLSTHHPEYVFSEAEKREIVEEWNDHLGRETAAKILRKPWFEHEGTRQNPDGTEQLLGIHNRMDYQTVEHMGNMAMLFFVASFDGPEGAVWRNYMGTPCPKSYLSNGDKKIDASMTNVFGSPYMTEDDWRLPTV